VLESTDRTSTDAAFSALETLKLVRLDAFPTLASPLISLFPPQGEMVIEYAGELIRSTLTDKRERYYDSKGIGCYMFKIDDNLVVDATVERRRGSSITRVT
jgi:hypothetical protein